MPYVCGLDCILVRNDSQISEKNPVSRIFAGWKKLTTANNHICGTLWTDAAVPENLIHLVFWVFLALATAVNEFVINKLVKLSML